MAMPQHTTTSITRYTDIRIASTIPRCYGCKLDASAEGWVGVRVHRSIWKKLVADGLPENALLCVNCIGRRCAALGLSNVAIQIVTGPLRVVSHSASEWFITEYAEHLRAEDRAEKTIYNYVIDVRSFSEWLIGAGRSTSLLAIGSQAVISYRYHLQQIGRKPNTINRNLVSLRVYFDWLVATERTLRNPVKPVKRVAQVRPKPRKLSTDEVGRFMAAVGEHGTPRDVAFFSLLIHTGLRSAEARDLRWDALTLHRMPALVEVRGGKGNKYRTVPLNGTVQAELLAYRGTLAPPPRREDYVFGGGRPFAQKSMHNVLKRMAERAGVVDVSAHDFRHFFAYQIVRDTPIHILQELMGHADIATTTIYTGPTMDDLVAATARLSG